MKYRYNGIELGDKLENIINLLNNGNIQYPVKILENDFDYYHFVYKPEIKVKNIDTEIYIRIDTNKVDKMEIFDKNFFPKKELKIGNKITKELIEKYDLYLSEFEPEEFYFSKRYKNFIICSDYGIGDENNEKILGYIFYNSDEESYFVEDKIINYLDCRNFIELINSFLESKSLKIDIKNREIIGKLNNYEFVFDLLSRDTKSITDIKTGKVIKIFKNINNSLELKKISTQQPKKPIEQTYDSIRNWLLPLLREDDKIIFPKEEFLEKVKFFDETEKLRTFNVIKLAVEHDNYCVKFEEAKTIKGYEVIKAFGEMLEIAVEEEVVEKMEETEVEEEKKLTPQQLRKKYFLKRMKGEDK